MSESTLWCPEVRSPKGYRLSTYTEAIGERIVGLYAEGHSLRTISRMDGMPGLMTMFDWRHAHPTFRSALARAREAKAESMVEDGKAAVLEPLDLTLDGKVAGPGVTRQGNIANYLFRMAERLDPQSWGQRTQHDVSGLVAVVTLPLDLMLPAATAATNDGRNVHDPRVLELRALAAARRPVDGKQGV